jgi:hypothetical protein
MEITVEMPLISECDATHCVYNLNSACHAKAITVGDGVMPGCDTFMKGSGHVKNSSINGGVGACKVSVCSFNTDFECFAEGISIAQQGDMIHCMTYLPHR